MNNRKANKLVELMICKSEEEFRDSIKRNVLRKCIIDTNIKHSFFEFINYCSYEQLLKIHNFASSISWQEMINAFEKYIYKYIN